MLVDRSTHFVDQTVTNLVLEELGFIDVGPGSRKNYFACNYNLLPNVIQLVNSKL